MMLLKQDKFDDVARALARRATVLRPEDAPDFPRAALLPRVEQLYACADDTINEAAPAAPMILLGLKPCDVAAIERLDMIFLHGSYADKPYALRRRSLLLVAIACAEAGPACFCTSVGVDPAIAPGADVLLIPTAGGWNVAAQSEAGEELLAELMTRGLLERGDEQPLPAAICSVQADTANLAVLDDDGLWQKLARACIGCGICAAVCPTCHCFALTQQGNAALRCQDSCMFAGYTRMAGETAILPIAQRLRRRYLHKLRYFQQKEGQQLCVGCGRCIEHCPAGLDILEVCADER